MVYTKEDSQSLDFLRKSRVIEITIILIKILSYRNNYEAMCIFYGRMQYVPTVSLSSFFEKVFP